MASGPKFPIELNDQWQIVDDPLQWILQRRVAPGSTWTPVAFCRSPDGLLSNIEERISPPVPPEALRFLAELPDLHP